MKTKLMMNSPCLSLLLGHITRCNKIPWLQLMQLAKGPKVVKELFTLGKV